MQKASIGLCIDCKHSVMTSHDPRHMMCRRTVSPVHGGPKAFCVHEREDARGDCGEIGLYFAPKPPPPTLKDYFVRFLDWW